MIAFTFKHFTKLINVHLHSTYYTNNSTYLLSTCIKNRCHLPFCLNHNLTAPLKRPGWCVVSEGGAVFSEGVVVVCHGKFRSAVEAGNRRVQKHRWWNTA